MKFIEHFLSMALFALGTIFAYNSKLKIGTAMLIIGLAIGLFNHVMIQDEWGYSKELFQDNIIDMKKTQAFDFKQIFCNILTAKWTCWLNDD